MPKIPKEFGLEISKTYPVKTIEQIRREFFKYHTYKETLSTGKRTFASNPNALVLNHPLIARDEDEFSAEIWAAVYCKGYYVLIDKNINHLTGPHAAKLFLQIYAGKLGQWDGRFIHLGTTQFRFNFYSRPLLLKKLSKAIRLREFWCSESTAETLIEFDEPRPKIINVT